MDLVLSHCTGQSTFKVTDSFFYKQSNPYMPYTMAALIVILPILAEVTTEKKKRTLVWTDAIPHTTEDYIIQENADSRIKFKNPS